MTFFDRASVGTGRLVLLTAALAAGGAISLPLPAAAYSFGAKLVIEAGGFGHAALDTCGPGAACAGGLTCEAFYPEDPMGIRHHCVDLEATPVVCDGTAQCPLRSGLPRPTCHRMPSLEGGTFVGVCIYETANWCPEGSLSDEDIRECLTNDAGLADAYGGGDCDGDGIPNRNETEAGLCVVPPPPPTDAGSPPMDAGLPTDASIPPDTGVVIEGGDGHEDTGAPGDEDGGTPQPHVDGGDHDAANDTTDFRGSGGCTCDASSPGSARGNLANLALALLIGLGLMRRRRG